MEGNYTTAINQNSEPITLESMKKAIKEIKPYKKTWIEASRKHSEQLKKMLVDKEIDEKPGVLIGNLYGIEVRIVPYLKKVRICKEK